MAAFDLPELGELRELAALLDADEHLYVRWSRGPDVDLADQESSADDLTGAEMPGLSASGLAVERWWGDRSTTVWVARRLYDYCHLRHDKGPGVRPWVLSGREVGRGPDNEPLVREVRPVAWIGEAVIAEAERLVAEQPRPWGPLRRPPENGTGPG